jgi:hypothetical protein
LTNGLVEDPLAIYHHGKDLDGHMAEGVMADDGAVTHECVEGFLGSQDGGGQTPSTRISLYRLLRKRKWQR